MMTRIERVVYAVLALVGTSLNAQANRDPYELIFHQVNQNLTFVSRPDMGRFPLVANSVILTSDDGILLVDGGGGVPVARQIIEHIRSMTNKPVLYLVLTHWHNDHSIGIDLYQQAFPGMKILAHPETIKYIATVLLERTKTAPDRIRNTTQYFINSLDTMMVTEGDPISERDYQYSYQALQDTVFTYPAYDVESVAVPEVPVSDRKLINMGDLTVDVRYLGVGGTLGDLVVWVPELEILMGGDLFTYPVPFGYPNDYIALIETMDAALEFPYKWLIPGHGEIQEGKKIAHQVRGLFKRTSNRIEKLVAQGLTKEEVAESMDFSKDERLFCKADSTQLLFFRSWFVTPALDGKYDQARSNQGMP
ncbi:MBL fold metallo-hydrolase [Candidatus Neomarinimicrobiota bacterium]